MKKIILVVVCCLCLCGCGNSNKKLDIKSIETSLKQISEISDTCIVTEENDPNGQLNKEGGYIEALFFKHTNLETDSAKDACQDGTSAGGSIEIYKNANDAEKRNEYLSKFDGSFLSDFHQVDGTIVVRISNGLTASEQKALYNEIIDKIHSTN